MLPAFASLSAFALALLPLLAAPPAGGADLLLVGGTVWPGKGLPRATAIAIRGDRVVAVGTDAEVLSLRGPGTRVVPLAGRLVLPGFNDAHVHFLSGGRSLGSLDLRAAQDEADMARLVGAYARTLPKGRWVLDGRWDHESWPSKKLPTKASLDAVAADNPVFVERLDGHLGLASSRALALAGITRATPDPPGGTIVRDAAGEPTGVLKDNAMDLLSKAIPAPTFEEDLEAARAALKEAARLGVTSVQDNSPVSALRVYLQLAARGELTARVNAWQNASSLDALLAAGIPGGLGDDRVRIGAVKIVLDGSMGAGTAAFFAPYADDPATSGLLTVPPEEMARMVHRADAGGLQLAVHAIGDRANALALDAFEAAAKANPQRDRRFRVEHAQVVRAADLPRWKALGAVASIQPCHSVDDLRWGRKRIGDRIADGWRIRSFLERGIPVAFGTDWPVAPLDPRVGVWAAVTKAPPPGVPAGDWNVAEKVRLEEALDLYTRGSAYAEFAEGAKGTLEPGRLADLVVLGTDLFAEAAADPARILAAPVDLTVAGGRVVFERGARAR